MIISYVVIFLLLIVLMVWVIRLKKEIKWYKTLIDDAPIFIGAFNKDRKCFIWNKESRKAFGWSMDEINAVDNPLALFYPDNDDQEKIEERNISSSGYRIVDGYPRAKNGDAIISQWATIVLSDGKIIGIGYDVKEQNPQIIREKTLQLNETKYKLAELTVTLEDRVKTEVKKNIEHQKLMLQQSRFAQMGEIISMIAHQWRQPLHSLSLIIQDAVFQQKVGKLDAGVIQRLDVESNKQIQEMTKTIIGFKNFFKPDKSSVEFEISSVISDAIYIIEPMLKSEEIRLDVDVQKGVNIVGFPTEFGQSIVNIIVNAKDALVEKHIKEKHITIQLLVDSDTVTISIKDNAGGIPSDIIDNIFDPYFSTKTEKNGTGLGLYITKIIIEEHMRGKISIENDENGAVFSIYN